MAKYLDENGLSTLWGRIKTLHGTSGGGTTTIDYTINGKAISSNPVLIGNDIATSYSDKTTIADKFSQYLPLTGGVINGTITFGGSSTNLGIDYYRIFKSVDGSTYSYSFPTASGMLVVDSQLATINGKSLVNGGADITIDSNLFVIVESLDSVTSPDSNKIYLVPKTNASGSITYVQYMYVDGSWKELGEDTASVDLSDYLTKADAAATYLSLSGGTVTGPIQGAEMTLGYLQVDQGAQIDGQFSVSDGIDVSGGATFSDDVTINANLDAGTANIGTLVVDDTAKIGTLTTMSGATLDSLTVNGTSTLKGGVTTSGDLYVAGTASMGQVVSSHGEFNTIEVDDRIIHTADDILYEYTLPEKSGTIALLDDINSSGTTTDMSAYVTKEGLSKAVHEISSLSATVGTQVATIEMQTVDYNAVTGVSGVNTKSCSIPAASTSKAGMMTAVDKTNLNSAYNNITLSGTTSGDTTVYTLTPFTANGPYTSKIISFSVPVVTAITIAEIDEVCV